MSKYSKSKTFFVCLCQIVCLLPIGSKSVTVVESVKPVYDPVIISSSIIIIIIITCQPASCLTVPNLLFSWRRRPCFCIVRHLSLMSTLVLWGILPFTSLTTAAQLPTPCFCTAKYTYTHTHTNKQPSYLHRASQGLQLRGGRELRPEAASPISTS